MNELKTILLWPFTIVKLKNCTAVVGLEQRENVGLLNLNRFKIIIFII